MSILTYRYRIKDATSGKHLLRMAWACNTVWNFCQEVSLLGMAQREEVADGLRPDHPVRWCERRAWPATLTRSAKSAGNTSRSARPATSVVCTGGVGSARWLGPVQDAVLKMDGDSIRYLQRRFRFWASRPSRARQRQGALAKTLADTGM